MKLGIWVKVNVMRDSKSFLQSRSRSQRSENSQIRFHAKSIGSNRVIRSKWWFSYYQSLVPSLGRNEAGFLNFVPGARSRDTELGLFGQVSKMWRTEDGDDRPYGTNFLLDSHYTLWIQILP